MIHGAAYALGTALGLACIPFAAYLLYELVQACGWAFSPEARSYRDRWFMPVATLVALALVALFFGRPFDVARGVRGVADAWGTWSPD